MIAIVTDSSCGISEKEAKKMGFYIIPMPFIIDNKEYFEDKNISKKDFYKLLMKDISIHTSQQSIEDVIETFDNLLKTYDEILYLPITSGLSSAYNSALILVENQYKGKVFVVDHKAISVALRYVIMDALEMVKDGLKAKEIKELIEKNNMNSIYLSVDTLTYLKKGGRISPFVATVGNLLKIKPILYSDGGKFDVVRKVRTIEQVKENFKELILIDMNDKFKDTNISNYSIGLAYINNIDVAKSFYNEFKTYFKHLKNEMLLDELPLIVGCHLGPGAIGIAIRKNIKWK